MRMSIMLILALSLALPAQAAEFSISPYLYSTETDSSVQSISFSHNNATATLYKVGGEEAMLSLAGALVTEKAQVRTVLSDYYYQNFYPTSEELSDILAQADSFNKSRNYKTRFGPAEQICYTSATFLSYKPCSDYTTCQITASLVCTISGADGCEVDTLANHILTYKKSIDKLNNAYAKFSGAHSSFSAETASASLTSMDEAFSEMKVGADEVMQSKLRFPETSTCMDCIAICPEAHFDYNAITAGKAKVAALKQKSAPLLAMDTTIEKVYLATTDRLKYREGEEKAKIYKPRYDSTVAKFAGLKAQAVEAKALAADSSFTSAADEFLNSGDSLEQKLATRQFEGFDALLSSYDSAGKKLQLMINNSTSAYRAALDAQDDASDAILQAQWRVNRISKASVDSYNALANKKSRIDADFAPPKVSQEYASLSSRYKNLTLEAQDYVAASRGAEESVFGAGNAFSRASVDTAMGLVSSMSPVSFKTRQSVAKFIPPLVVGAIDLLLLGIFIAIFAYCFMHFRNFFRSKLAISGWALTLLGLMFVLIIGSVGFYSIVLSTERFTSFTEFMDVLESSNKAAIIVDEKGASAEAIAGMRACADQIVSQLNARGIMAQKYYVSSTACTSMLQKTGLNNTSVSYDTKTGLSPANCLDSIPDMPVFDLQYSKENVAPSFTTVVTKQALIKGNEAYYGKKPMCDAANVLG